MPECLHSRMSIHYKGFIGQPLEIIFIRMFPKDCKSTLQVDNLTQQKNQQFLELCVSFNDQPRGRLFFVDQPVLNSCSDSYSPLMKIIVNHFNDFAGK